MQAVIAALERDSRPLEVRTDSAHVRDGVYTHRHRWRQLGWRPRVLSTAEIRNADRWRRLDELIRTRGEGYDKVIWVKGHTSQAQVDAKEATPFNHHGNSAADLLATTCAACHGVPAAEIRAAAARVELAIRTQRMFLEIATARAKALQSRGLPTDPDICDSARRCENAAPKSDRAYVSDTSALYPWEWSPPQPHQQGPPQLSAKTRKMKITRNFDGQLRVEWLPKKGQLSFYLGATSGKALLWWVE
jgi:ribonuclease HI